MLIPEDLKTWRVQLRELISAGEPLNPEVIEQVRAAWKISIRDGYGQTETTAQIGNPAGAPIKTGSMGRPLPGYTIVLFDADGQAANEGEICIELAQRPKALMNGYADDVFRSSGYRISPFELESALIEHPAVAEAVVVPAPDPLRGLVPKAYVVLASGHAADADTAAEIFKFMQDRVSGYKRVRRIEFSDLPKTLSGKIRRVDLRTQENPRASQGGRYTGEFWEKTS